LLKINEVSYLKIKTFRKLGKVKEEAAKLIAALMEIMTSEDAMFEVRFFWFLLI
jgi:hypothetical protein